jgi:hypothetical protein
VHGDHDFAIIEFRVILYWKLIKIYKNDLFNKSMPLHHIGPSICTFTSQPNKKYGIYNDFCHWKKI